MRLATLLIFASFLGTAGGCATQKESHTARTGVEQLLVSSAIDKSLDNFDYAPLRARGVFLETKYLDCVDKNYVIVSLRQRILQQGGKLLDKADGADVIVEVSSGGVGTDGQELFIGIPEIPLPPPSPIAIPRLSLLTRTRMNGTAKLLVIAYDAKTRAPVYPFGAALARSDQNNWNVLAMGPFQTGSVTREIATSNPEPDLSVTGLFHFARQRSQPASTDAPSTAQPNDVIQVEHPEPRSLPAPKNFPLENGPRSSRGPNY